MAGAVMGMMATRTMHPPAAGTALIATIGADSIHDLGLIYPLVPVFRSVEVLTDVIACLCGWLPGRGRGRRARL